MGPCAKTQVRCTIIAKDGQRFVGENLCRNPQVMCPREPGEDYAKCTSICAQPGHAEVMAIRAAQHIGASLTDGVAYIEGHTHACVSCRQALDTVGIADIVIGSPDEAEADPAGRNPHEPGAKLDAGKAPVMRGVFQYFPRALMAVAEVSEVGANKYAWRGWETVPDGISRYGDALARHILKEEIEGPIDADTGKLHAAQEAWNALARLELMLREAGQ